MNERLTVFDDIPLFTLKKKKNRFLYSLSDVTGWYVGFKYKSETIEFKVYFRRVNRLYAAYSLRYRKDVKVSFGPTYVVALNNSVMCKPKKIKTLYQDRVVRFIRIQGKKNDFLFIIKNPKLKDEEQDG